MTPEITRSALRPFAVCLLLVAVGLFWYFSQAGTQRGAKELATISPSRTKAAERSAPDPTQERRRSETRSLAVQKWYEKLLEKYPEMKPEFRDVPDEQNGFLQFLLLAESLKEPKLPEELRAMLRGDSTWEPAKFKAWVAENKDYCDRILHIAELSNQSIKGLDFGRLAQGRSSQFGSEFGYILNSSARLAFEEGDQESALRYGKASISLSGHFTDIEVPSILTEVIAEGVRSVARESFVENTLPNLSNNPQALAAWHEALFRNEKPAHEYARVLAGEWNTMARAYVIPILFGDLSPTNGESVAAFDNDAFFEHYTAATKALASNLSNLGPDRLDLSKSDYEFPDSGIDTPTLQMLQGIAFQSQNIFNGLGAHVSRTAMASAAIAILIGKEPTIDPLSGKPFLWDPVSRTLSAPEGVDGLDPIKLR